MDGRGHLMDSPPGWNCLTSLRAPVRVGFSSSDKQTDNGVAARIPFEGEEALNAALRRGYSYALSLARNPSLAEDLVQEACVSILRSKATICEQTMIVAVRSRWYDNRRRFGAGVRLMGRLIALTEQRNGGAFTGDGEADPELADALRALRDVERESLYLMYGRGFSATEIAEIMQRPRGSVLSTIARARLKLKRALESVEQDAHEDLI